MTIAKFKPNDIVKAKGLRGPKMLVGSVHSMLTGSTVGISGTGYTCGWFDKEDRWVTTIFNENAIEKV